MIKMVMIMHGADGDNENKGIENWKSHGNDF